MGDASLPANTWSTLVSVAESDSASNTTFAGPAICAPAGNLHGAYAAREAGNVAVNRAMYTRPPAGGLATATWTEPAPLDAEASTGVAFASSSSQVWVTTPAGAWGSAIGSTVDLSARVISCRYDVTPSGAKAVLELDNHSATMFPTSATGPAAPYGLTPGGTLTITPGYKSGTAQAVETGVTITLLVDAIEHTWQDGRQTVTVHASSPLDQLARWSPPQTWQVATAASTRAAIAARIAARGGFSLASASAPLQPSADWTAYSPAFAINPGENGAQALTRLFSVVPDEIRPETSGQLTVVGLTRYRQEVLADSPVGFWRFDDPTGATVTDRSGGGRNATLSGTYARAIRQTYLKGDPATATRLDGASAYASVADNNAWSIDTTGKLSIEILLTPAAWDTGTNQGIISKGSPAGGYEWALYTNSVGQLVLLILTAAFGNIITPIVYSPGLVAGSTYHVVATIDYGVAARLFINAVEIGSATTFTGLYTNGTGPLLIGDLTAFAMYWKGLVQDAAVYSTVLSPARVAAHYAAMNPSDYTYGGSGAHPVYHAVAADQLARDNWTRVQSSDRYADALTSSQVALAGPRLKLLRNLDQDTDTKARLAAGNAIRRTEQARPAGRLIAPFNAGQQLYDVISITDSRLSLSASRYRVIGCGLDYRRGPAGARYNSLLDLAPL